METNEIGRKIYLNWGNCIIAIEKIIDYENELERCGLIKDGNKLPAALFQLNAVSGCIVEQHLEKDYGPGVGDNNVCPKDISQLCGNSFYWLTEEELELVKNSKLNKETL